MQTEAKNDHYVAVHAVAMYAWNRAPREWVGAVFPDAHPDYVDEKIRAAELNFWAFYGGLDIDNKKVLVDAALAAYGEEAAMRFAQ